jgi:hypothetical protein
MEDPVSELRTGLRPGGGVGQLDRAFSQLRHLVPAPLAGIEVPLVRPAILRIEGVQGVGRRQVVKLSQRNCLRA